MKLIQKPLVRHQGDPNPEPFEIAVRSVVNGDPVRNTEALANPEALRYFRDIEELTVE